MPFSLHQSTKLQVGATGLAACLVVLALAAGASPRFHFASAQQKGEAAAGQAPLIVEEITLRPEGFYPARLSRPKGAFLLVVCNRTGMEEVNITLAREVGNGSKERVKEARVQRKVLDWSSPLDLNPGTYLLTEAGNPRWVCELTITSR